MKIFYTSIMHVLRPCNNEIAKGQLSFFTGQPKAILTVFLFLAMLFVSRNVQSQTYSGYQFGDQTTYAVNQWSGYVYTNQDFNSSSYMGFYLTGSSDFSTDWGNGGPGPFGSTYMSDNDYFWIRYRMNKTYENGLYTFSSNCDDGVKVYYSNTSGSTWTTTIDDFSCTASTRTSTNVNLNGNYNFIMEYKECTGGAHAGISITQTCQVPGTTQNPTGVGTGFTTATISWSAGVPVGTNTQYIYNVKRASDNASIAYSQTTALSVSLTGLTANTGYYVEVFSQALCYNTVNSATATSPVFYTYVAPGAPTSLTATATGTTTASLSWAAGSPVGNPAPTYYWVVKNTGGTTITSGNTTSTSASATGLSANTIYYFTVYASNSAGSSSVATSQNFATLPTPPTSVTATPSTIAVGNSSNLNATSAGNTINWYSVATGGTSLGSSASAANYPVTPSTTTSYYAEAFSPPYNNGSLALQTSTKWAIYGVMFDVTTLSAPKAVTGFLFYPGAAVVRTFKVYYKIGTYVGSETNSSAWTYLGDFNNDGQLTSSLLDITDVTIPAATTYAFYLYNQPVTYTMLQVKDVASTYSDASLSVVSGSGTMSLFGTVSTDLTLRGSVQYANPGQASATRTSVGVTVTQAPATQASGVTFSSVGATQMGVSWAIGNGSNRAVFIKAASSGNAAPVNGTAYGASTTFGSGTQIESTGWYCVYNGIGTSVTVTGLSASTAYQVHVCEYNGSTGNEAYNTNSATNNPKSQTTLAVPTISDFTPTSAGTGVSVVITGTYLTGTTAVSFGGTAANNFSVVNATSITAVVASGTTGSVSVTTPGGTATLAGFTFIPAPTITSFTPTSAATGTTVTLTGTNFTGATAVSFGGTAASSYTVNSATKITATVSGGTTGSVSVTTPGGTATLAGFTFTLPAPPTGVTATPSTIAVGNSSNLNATSAGNTINWYTVATGGTLLGSSASGANYPVTPATTTTYYAEAFLPLSGVTDLPLATSNTTGASGVMFNVTTLTEARAITGFSFAPNVSGVQTIKVYYKSGTYVGYQSNSAAWTLLGDFNSDGQSGSSLLDITDLIIPVNTTYAFYIYSNSAGGLFFHGIASTHADASLSVVSGSVMLDLFGSSYPNYTWQGSVKHAIPSQTSASRTSVGVTLTQAPATQASGVTFSSVGSTQTSVSWAIGSGTSRAVFVKAASSGNAAPVNGTAYGASTTFGSGTQIGSLGWYCVYNGDGTSVTVTGLSANTAYQVHVCEYNGTSGNEAYNTNSATNNPKSQTTATPTITTSGTLSAFTSCSGTASAAQNFSASGSTLVADIIVTPPTGFGVCLTSGGTYTGSVTLTQSGGTVSSTTIYVRLTSSATGSPSGNVSLTSTSATTKTVAASGTVNIASTSPTSITGTTTVCSGSTTTLTANGGTTGTSCTYEWGTGASVGSNIIVGATSVSYTTPTLSTATTYWVRRKDPAPCSTTTGGVTQAVTVNTPSTAPTSITGTTTVCNGSTTTLTANGGTTGTSCTYEWGTGASVGSNIIGGATSVSYTTLTLSTATTYWVRRKDPSPCSTITGGATQAVTVNSISTAPTSITGTTTICNGATTILTASGGTAGTSCTYEWGTGSTVGSNAVVGATSESYTTPALSSSTTYWVRRIDPSPCSTITGGATQTVTVNPTSVGGTAAATSSSVCSGTSTTVTVSGYTGAIQWQQSANGTTGWANVTGGSGATTATYTTPNLIATTYYRAVLTSGVCSLDYSTTTSVTVTTNQWQGSATGDWEVAGNWCGGIPTIDNDVVIPTGNTVTVTSATGTPAACKNLTINGTLVISAGKALTISGELVNNSGSTGLIIESNAIGTGSLLHGSAGVNATVQRYVSGNTNLETMTYHLVSVPLSTAGNPMSEIFTGSYLYKFDESKAIAESWVAMGTATNTALPVSGGYMVYSPEASHTYLFQGPINAGAFNAAVSYSNNHYNLVPNPYPSAIDWDATSGWTRDGSKIANAIYMWPSGEGNYAAYVAGASSYGGSRYIPSGQAFFVQTIGESPVLAMNDNVRVHNSQPFYKNDEQIPDLLRITADANNYKDEVVVRFTENATTSADYDYDAWKIYGLEGAPQLYTLASNNEMLAINSLPYLETAYTVPLNFELKAEKPVTFTFSSIESFDQSVSIYLKDELANQTIDLRSHPVYTFNHSLGNAAKRFKLIFGGAIGIDEPKADANKMWVSGNTLYINAPELAKKQSLIEVFNPAGQRLVAKNLVLDEITTFDLTVEGFVVVKLTSGQKVMTAKGILIK